MKKVRLFLTFSLVLFAILFFSHFLVIRSSAYSFNQTHLFLERMQIGVETGMVLMFTPMSDFDDSGIEKTLRIYFPKGETEDYEWCLQDEGVLSVAGASESPVDVGDWSIGEALPGGESLEAMCHQGPEGGMDYIEITGVGDLIGGTSYGLEIAENGDVFKTGLSSGGNLISLQLFEEEKSATISFEVNLLTSDQVSVEAYVSEAGTITCTVGDNVNLGVLFLGGTYVTGSHELGNETSGFGFYWAVRGEGNSTTPGLVHQNNSEAVLSSLGDGDTVSLITEEGFGLVVSNSTLGSIQPNYQQSTPGIFGAIHRDPRLLLYSEESGEGDYTITLGARASITALPGAYQEELTYICGGYIGDVAPEIPADACGDETEEELHGETYSIVAIGDQCWMAENLNYDDGCSEIDWEDNNDVGWCGCYFENASNCLTYGLLYQWSVAQNVCPEGWSLPSDEDWKELEMHLGMSQIDADSTEWRNTGEVGVKLKTSTWNGDNSSGFTALPGGNRIESGDFSGFAGGANFWTSTSSGGNSFGRTLGSAQVGVGREWADQAAGYSVRCVKD